MGWDGLSSIELGVEDLTIEQVWAIAHRQAEARLSAKPEVMARVTRSAKHVENMLKRDGVIYGVTTGYGDSCTTDSAADIIAELAAAPDALPRLRHGPLPHARGNARGAWRCACGAAARLVRRVAVNC